MRGIEAAEVEQEMIFSGELPVQARAKGRVGIETQVLLKIDRNGVTLSLNGPGWGGVEPSAIESQSVLVEIFVLLGVNRRGETKKQKQSGLESPFAVNSTGSDSSHTAASGDLLSSVITMHAMCHTWPRDEAVVIGQGRLQTCQGSRVFRKGLNPQPLPNFDWRLEVLSVAANCLGRIPRLLISASLNFVSASDISEAPRNDGAVVTANGGVMSSVGARKCSQSLQLHPVSVGSWLLACRLQLDPDASTSKVLPGISGTREWSQPEARLKPLEIALRHRTRGWLSSTDVDALR